MSLLALLAAGCTTTSPMMGGYGPTPTYGMMYGTGPTYGMMNGSGYGMMQTVEERSMNATVHDEMEGLMEKMIAGNMTPTEQDRLVQLMNRQEKDMWKSVSPWTIWRSKRKQHR